MKFKYGVEKDQKVGCEELTPLCTKNFSLKNNRQITMTITLQRFGFICGAVKIEITREKL